MLMKPVAATFQLLFEAPPFRHIVQGGNSRIFPDHWRGAAQDSPERPVFVELCSVTLDSGTRQLSFAGTFSLSSVMHEINPIASTRVHSGDNVAGAPRIEAAEAARLLVMQGMSCESARTLQLLDGLGAQQ